MIKINDPANMESDWFAMNLAYADGQKPRYNGNIASMTWKSVRYDNPHHYDFTYDGADRLREANYDGERDYRMSINEYDKNGNIKELSRYGRLGESSDYSWIDALDYTYEGNQLQSVDDYTGVDFQNNGYSDHGSFDNNECLYDANGNMIKDENKQIGDVEYTYNNRPERIIMTQNRENIINYAYDATGTKLAKRPSSSRARGQRTDYVGNFVYKNNELAYILTDQGRIVPRNDGFEYQYFIKDHLGNTRVVFNDDGEILQDNSYYPFGMLERSGNPDTSGKMDGLDYTAGLDPENKHLYNGKELQDDFGLDWYDYGARMYDAQLGRWHVADPRTEKFVSMTTYQYASNNPIACIDIDGMEGYKVTTKNVQTGTTEVKFHFDIQVKNNSSASQSQVNKWSKSIANSAENIFQGSDRSNNKQYSTDINLQFNTDESEDQFVLQFKDKVFSKDNYGGVVVKTPAVGEVKEIGNVISNEMKIMIPGKSHERGYEEVSEESLKHTGPHELGHTSGLRHEKNVDEKNDTKIGPDNLMYLGGDGEEIIMKQLKKMEKVIPQRK